MSVLDDPVFRERLRGAMVAHAEHIAMCSVEDNGCTFCKVLGKLYLDEIVRRRSDDCS